MTVSTNLSKLKSELRQRGEELGVESAILPEPDARIDEIIQQLEEINPTPQPLNSTNFPHLFTDWELIYASRGTVVTRNLASIPAWGVKIKRVWQTLGKGKEGTISSSNAAEIELALLGKYKIQADGIWQLDPDEQVAKVTFDTFSVQAIKLLGISSLNLPELKIPVLEFMRSQAYWKTSYLDDEIRIGRGATGNIFVFLRHCIDGSPR